MQVVIIKRAFGSNPYARFELGNCKKLGSKNIRVLYWLVSQKWMKRYINVGANNFIERTYGDINCGRSC